VNDYLKNKIPHVKFRYHKILELSHRVEEEFGGPERDAWNTQGTFSGTKGK
jgi:hypothetical protein